MAKVKTKTTRQMSSNVALRVWYKKELMRQIDRMAKRTERELLKAWKSSENKMRVEEQQASPFVYDASPAVGLSKLINSLRYYFVNHFSGLSRRVAERMASKAESGASVSLKSILKEEGFTVNFRMTRQMNDIMQAIIAENVGLIKTIPADYFAQIETIVMQGVKNGRDLEFIKGELLKRYNITERRAQIISRDQTNKATQAIARARANETGITTAKWVHIPGAKTSREEHKKFNGQVFDLKTGLYDKKVGRNVLPGELINCNCRFRLVVPSVGE